MNKQTNKQTNKWTNEQTNKRTDGKSPHSTGLRPLLGPLPKKKKTALVAERDGFPDSYKLCRNELSDQWAGGLTYTLYLENYLVDQVVNLPFLHSFE